MTKISVHSNDQQTRQAVFMGLQSIRPKEDHQIRSSTKSLLVVFFHIGGLEHCELNLQGQTVHTKCVMLLGV